MTKIFENTEWTDFLWEDHQRFEESARKVIREGVDKFAESFEDFGNETFSRFYAEPNKVEEIPAGAEWADKLHKCMEDVPEFQTLKEFCKGSDWKSGVAATSMIDELMRTVTPPEEPFEDVQKAEEVRDYLKQLFADENLTDEQRDALKESLDIAQNEVDKKAQANQDAANLMDATQVRNAVRKAAAGAKSEIHEVEDAMLGLGCGNAKHKDTRGSMSAKALIQTLRANPKLQEILKMAGRLKRLAQQKQKAKPRQGTNEFTGVVSGDNISRVLPCEAMMLMDDMMELVFARKMQERSLLEYELKEKPEEEQGPIVMLLDCSGSMSWASRDVWASAVALAFLSVSREQNRDFAMIHFSESVRKVTLFEGKAPVDMPSMLNAVLSCGPSGGTNFELPLTEGLKVINHFGAFKKADIIMVTDGDAPVSPNFLSNSYLPAKKDYEISCYTVLVGDEGRQENAMRFSDKVISLKDALKDEAKMHDLFGEV